MGCAFCGIKDERIIRDTQNTITILSNPYLVEGHSLVIPKMHVQRISELTMPVAYELFDEVVRMQNMVLERLGAPGCDIRQNFRPFLPDSRLKVGHLHFHVIPRYKEDELYLKSMIYEKDVFRELQDEQSRLIMERLR
jgi:histidine triad (HIT) family protein